MDYHDIAWFALEMNRDHSVVTELHPSTALKIQHIPPIYSFLFLSAGGNHWPFYCLHDFVFSRMSHSCNQKVCSLFRLPSFSSYCAFHTFSWLDGSPLSRTNNVSFSRYTTMYLSIHLLKGVLVTFNFCYKQKAGGTHSHVCFCFFGCDVASGIPLSRPEMNPGPPHWKH